MKRGDCKGFVADGQARVENAERPRVEREVRARYVERLAAAGLWGRFRLRSQMRREIERELKRLAPPDGLY